MHGHWNPEWRGREHRRVVTGRWIYTCTYNRAKHTTTSITTRSTTELPNTASNPLHHTTSRDTTRWLSGMLEAVMD
jgi:hypothetical protein